MKIIPLAVFALLAPSIACATTIYDEAVDGDLSNDRFNPTPFVLSLGSNVLFGVMDGVDDSGNFDRDFFSVTVPAGFTLERIDLLDYQSKDFAAFIAIDAGPVFSIDPDDVAAGDLMGWALFGPFDVGGDLLAMMSVNGMGFSPPLGPGTYSFWAQQTGDFTTWTADFVLVPAPGGAAVLLLAGAAGLRRRR